MFDISFTELLVIGVIALIVIGPERLPKVARTAGQWVGKLNRFVSQVKQDIDRDVRLEELRKMQQEMKDSAQKYEIMANETMHRVEDAVTEETGQISKVMQAMGATDGGLTMREFEKTQAAQAAAADTPEQAGAETPPGPPAPESAATETPATDAPVAEGAPKAGEDKAQA